MALLIIAGALAFIGFYCMFAALLHIPTFQTSGRISRFVRAGNPRHTFMGLVAAIANPMAPYLTLDRVRKIKTAKILQAANVNMTPEQFTARKLVLAACIALPLALLGFMHRCFLSWPRFSLL